MQKKALQPKKVLFIARDDGGCGFFRCLQPANFLTRMGKMQGEYVFRTPTKEQLLDADLVIMQDMGSVESANLGKFMLDNRIPFMTEFDDFVHHVSPHNEGGYGAWNPSTLFLYRAMELTKKALGITVSTNQLAREFFPYNANIFVIPNYLDKEKWSQPAVKRSDGKIRIGWCGGNAHADDLLMVSKVIDKIVKEYKGKVVFETMGMTRKELAGVFPMKIQNETCISCGYEGELHHYPGESLDDYPTVLASRGWDIAIAPCINTAFNNSKSDLKIKEYSAVGLPIVASPIRPYLDAAESNAQILFASTFDEWYNSLKKLIEDSALRDEMVRANKDWVAQYWIQDNIESISEVYGRIIDAAETMLGTKEDRLRQKNLL